MEKLREAAQGRDEGSESERRREVILTAGQLFCKHGYERTTVRELARAVGLQSGSLFHHFRSKEEILVAVMNNGIQEVIDDGERALARYRAPADRLAALFRVHMWSMLHGAGGDAMNALVYEWRSLSAPSRGAAARRCARHQALRAGRHEPDGAVVQAGRPLAARRIHRCDVAGLAAVVAGGRRQVARIGARQGRAFSPGA